MADNYIQLPADGSGKKLDSDELVVGANTVHRERDRIAGAGAAEIADVKASDPAGSLYGLVTRPIGVVAPVRSALSSSNLAAGASVNLDATTIASGKTGKLMGVYVASTVPCKWVIQTRDGASVVNVGVMVTSPMRLMESWEPPDKRFDTLAYGNGDENFRVAVTSLDARNAGDVYATVYFDEV